MNNNYDLDQYNSEAANWRAVEITMLLVVIVAVFAGLFLTLS